MQMCYFGVRVRGSRTPRSHIRLAVIFSYGLCGVGARHSAITFSMQTFYSSWKTKHIRSFIQAVGLRVLAYNAHKQRKHLYVPPNQFSSAIFPFVPPFFVCLLDRNQYFPSFSVGIFLTLCARTAHTFHMLSLPVFQGSCSPIHSAAVSVSDFHRIQKFGTPLIVSFDPIFPQDPRWRDLDAYIHIPQQRQLWNPSTSDILYSHIQSCCFDIFSSFHSFIRCADCFLFVCACMGPGRLHELFFEMPTVID